MIFEWDLDQRIESVNWIDWIWIKWIWLDQELDIELSDIIIIISEGYDCIVCMYCTELYCSCLSCVIVYVVCVELQFKLETRALFIIHFDILIYNTPRMWLIIISFDL